MHTPPPNSADELYTLAASLDKFECDWLTDNWIVSRLGSLANETLQKLLFKGLLEPNTYNTTSLGKAAKQVLLDSVAEERVPCYDPIAQL
jgi:hypothetical protein